MGNIDLAVVWQWIVDSWSATLASPWVQTTWEYAKGFGNSAFVSALLGAWFGAWAATRNAERSRAKEDLHTEIRHVNAASALAFTTCNAALQLKKQHVKDLAQGFKKQREAHLEFLKKMDAGQLPPNPEFQFDAIMRTMTPLQAPARELQAMCYDKLPLSAMAQAAVGSLAQSITDLNILIAEHTRLTEEFRTKNITMQAFAAIYFGTPIRRPEGVVHDERYRNAVEGIELLTDSAIFFSHLLNEELHQHGLSLVSDYKRMMRFKLMIKKFMGQSTKKLVPSVRYMSFESAVKEGLMPPAEDFEKWLIAFRLPSKEETKRGWRKWVPLLKKGTVAKSGAA